MEWISVAERLPEDGQDVLFQLENDDRDKMLYFDDVIIACCSQVLAGVFCATNSDVDGRWYPHFKENFYGACFTDAVERWAPLDI